VIFNAEARRRKGAEKKIAGIGKIFRIKNTEHGSLCLKTLNPEFLSAPLRLRASALKITLNVISGIWEGPPWDLGSGLQFCNLGMSECQA